MERQPDRAGHHRSACNRRHVRALRRFAERHEWWSNYSVNAGSELPTPIVYPVHHEICNVAVGTGGSGVGQVEVVLNGNYSGKLVWDYDRCNGAQCPAARPRKRMRKVGDYAGLRIALKPRVPSSRPLRGSSSRDDVLSTLLCNWEVERRKRGTSRLPAPEPPARV